jgi:hypothetical protein
VAAPGEKGRNEVHARSRRSRDEDSDLVSDLCRGMQPVTSDHSRSESAKDSSVAICGPNEMTGIG